jgi:hypothetical protein
LCFRIGVQLCSSTAEFPRTLRLRFDTDSESACPPPSYLMAIVNRLLGVLLITTRTPTADPVGAFMGSEH